MFSAELTRPPVVRFVGKRNLQLWDSPGQWWPHDFNCPCEMLQLNDVTSKTILVLNSRSEMCSLKHYYMSKGQSGTGLGLSIRTSYVFCSSDRIIAFIIVNEIQKTFLNVKISIFPPSRKPLPCIKQFRLK